MVALQSNPSFPMTRTGKSRFSPVATTHILRLAIDVRGPGEEGLPDASIESFRMAVKAYIMFISVDSIAPRNGRHKAGFGCSDDRNLGCVMTNIHLSKHVVFDKSDCKPTGIDNFGTSDSGTPGNTDTI